MHHQMYDIKNEKNYWMERLTRTTNELILKTTKKNRYMKPITKAKFLLFHKKHLQNRSVLAETGMLTLDNHLKRETKRGRGFHTLNDLGNTWTRAVSGSPSHFRRSNQLRAVKINGSGVPMRNFAATIGETNQAPAGRIHISGGRTVQKDSAKL